MPELSALEQFRKILSGLAREPEVAARWGEPESLAGVALAERSGAPEEGTQGARPATAQAEEIPESPAFEEAPSAEGEFEDFSNFVSNISLSEEPESRAQGSDRSGREIGQGETLIGDADGGDADGGDADGGDADGGDADGGERSAEAAAEADGGEDLDFTFEDLRAADNLSIQEGAPPEVPEDFFETTPDFGGEESSSSVIPPSFPEDRKKPEQPPAQKTSPSLLRKLIKAQRKAAKAESEGRAAAPGAAAPGVVAPEAGATAQEKKFALSQSQFEMFVQVLSSYPLNLRLAIEDIIGNEKGTEQQRVEAIAKIAQGCEAEDAANLARIILKQPIFVPPSYSKRSGQSYLARQKSFAVFVSRKLLPALRYIVLAAIAAFIIGYLGYRFIYSPIAAHSLYSKGAQYIAQELYPEAEDSFSQATALYELKEWYYRYARAYIEHRQFILAGNKYATLIYRYPKESRGILQWADMERSQLKYEEAVRILNGVPNPNSGPATLGLSGLLSWDYFNKDGLLLLGDTYLEWGYENPARYEDARFAYATLLEKYGNKDIYLGRMLRYLIRTDKESEVAPLQAHFMQDARAWVLGPEGVAELAGYLIDKNNTEGLRELLVKASARWSQVADIHYQLARLTHIFGDSADEKTALDNAIVLLSAEEVLGSHSTAMYIDSLIRRGELGLDTKRWLSADLDFTRASVEYEKALALKRVDANPVLARVYAGLGEVALWQRNDYQGALDFYSKALGQGYDTQKLRYRLGYSHYQLGDYKNALAQFYAATGPLAPGPTLAFALGITSLQRKDYPLAEAHFASAALKMTALLNQIGRSVPEERDARIRAMTMLMKAKNNLGVAQFLAGAQRGDAHSRSLAMASFTEAAKTWSQLSLASSLPDDEASLNLGLENINRLVSNSPRSSLRSYTIIDRGG